MTAEFLRKATVGKLNVIVSGATGSGKTTMLNVLSSYIPDNERIVTIEDAAELQLGQEHVLTLEARPANLEGRGMVTIRDLVRNSLRMRPDRIVVGEARGGEALDMLQAMNTGHDGSITTIHSNSPRDTLARIETMVLMAGFDMPVRAIREQVAGAVDLIVHLHRLRDGTRRVTHITEVLGMEGEVVTTQDVFLFDYGMGVDEDGFYKGHLKSTGLRPSFSKKLEDAGIKLPAGDVRPRGLCPRSRHLRSRMIRSRRPALVLLWLSGLLLPRRAAGGGPGRIGYRTGRRDRHHRHRHRSLSRHDGGGGHRQRRDLRCRRRLCARERRGDCQRDRDPDLPESGPGRHCARHRHE